MKIQTLSLVAALAMIGCSSKFDENGQTPEGEDAYADDNKDIDDDGNEEEEEEEVDPMNLDEDEDGFTPNEGDCDDDEADINPDADEVCDGLDNNCNDRVDEAMRFDTYWVDADGDGYGDPDNEVERCAEEDGYVFNSTDCDDTDAAVNPGAAEIIGDEIDNDCDSNLDERFDTATVSVDGNVGSASTVQVDDAGQVHIVYYDALGGDLLYSKRTVEGRWSETETIASDDNSGEFLDAIVDSTGVLHVSYTEANEYTRGLLYTQRSASGYWSPALVVDGFEPGEIDVGQYVSIALDSWNLPSFGFFDADFGVPIIADTTILGTAVLISADNNYMSGLFDDAHTGLYTSIAIDSSDNDHIAFYDPYANAGTSPEVQYSAFNTDLDDLVYSETIIEAAGGFISLAMRSDDVPCVAFQATVAMDLMYGCLVDGNWALETVDASGSVGRYASLDFNAYDEAYIAYYDQSNSRLMLAREDKEDSETPWELIEVDNDGDVGQAASLHVDTRSVAHMSYYDASHQTLKYATGG
jgi:hypothetical protein